MTVAELLARISSAELTEWKAVMLLDLEDAEAARLASAAQAGVTQRKARMRSGR